MVSALVRLFGPGRAGPIPAGPEFALAKTAAVQIHLALQQLVDRLLQGGLLLWRRRWRPGLPGRHDLRRARREQQCDRAASQAMVRFACGRRARCHSRQTFDAAFLEAGLRLERETSRGRRHRICRAPQLSLGEKRGESDEGHEKRATTRAAYLGAKISASAAAPASAGEVKLRERSNPGVRH